MSQSFSFVVFYCAWRSNDAHMSCLLIKMQPRSRTVTFLVSHSSSHSFGTPEEPRHCHWTRGEDKSRRQSWPEHIQDFLYTLPHSQAVTHLFPLGACGYPWRAMGVFLRGPGCSGTSFLTRSTLAASWADWLGPGNISDLVDAALCSAPMLRKSFASLDLRQKLGSAQGILTLSLIWGHNKSYLDSSQVCSFFYSHPVDSFHGGSV